MVVIYKMANKRMYLTHISEKTVIFSPRVIESKIYDDESFRYDIDRLVALRIVKRDN
jgi:hypothetical protein